MQMEVRRIDKVVTGGTYRLFPFIFPQNEKNKIFRKEFFCFPRSDSLNISGFANSNLCENLKFNFKDQISCKYDRCVCAV